MAHSNETLQGIRVGANAPIHAECDICKANGTKSVATIDGGTVMGPWAYMCDVCASTMLTSPALATRLVESHQ